MIKSNTTLVARLVAAREGVHRRVDDKEDGWMAYVRRHPATGVVFVA